MTDAVVDGAATRTGMGTSGLRAPGSPRGRPRGGVAEGLRTAARSSRVLLRQARARYSCDVLTWPYREDFADVWRTVDFIPGWFNEGSAALLYGVVRTERPDTIVEIGSYLGRSTVLFGLALQRTHPSGRVVAVDPHTGDRQQLEMLTADELPTYELFSRHIRNTGVAGFVEARVMPSTQAARGWEAPIDLLFVDGWHSYDAVLEDGVAWLPHLSERGVVVFDDYVAYDEVARAVHELADAGRFHLWGVVFGQAVGGAAPEPPAAVRRALALTPRGLWRRVRG